jgi:hypothetical protein
MFLPNDLSNEALRFHGSVCDGYYVVDCNTVLSGGKFGMQVVAEVPPNVGKFLLACMTHISEDWPLTESMLGCVVGRLTFN